MPTFTSFLRLPFPRRGQESWFDDEVAFKDRLDADLFAAVVDRNIIIMKGGTFRFNTTTNILTWTSPIEISDFNTGFSHVVPANFPTGIAMNDGQILTIDLSRGLDFTANITVNPQVVSKLLSSDRASLQKKLVLAVRRGTGPSTKIIFRNGNVLGADVDVDILEASTGGTALTISDFLSRYIRQEDPTGVINGTNLIFTTANNYVDNTLEVYINGIRRKKGASFDFVEKPGAIQNRFDMNVAPLLGSMLFVSYFKQV